MDLHGSVSLSLRISVCVDLHGFVRGPVCGSVHVRHLRSRDSPPAGTWRRRGRADATAACSGCSRTLRAASRGGAPGGRGGREHPAPPPRASARAEELIIRPARSPGHTHTRACMVLQLVRRCLLVELAVACSAPHGGAGVLRRGSAWISAQEIAAVQVLVQLVTQELRHLCNSMLALSATIRTCQRRPSGPWP